MKNKITEKRSFNKGIALHKVCGNDILRPITDYIFFQRGYAIASDGHILVKAYMKDISDFTEE